MCNCSKSLPQLNSEPKIIEQQPQSNVFIVCMIFFGSIVLFVLIVISAYYLQKYNPLNNKVV